MFLFLEPFYGGSHREFADGLCEHSRHDLELHVLPARFWKWRMRGAALHFAHRIPDPAGYAGLIATDLMSLADLKALWAESCPPVLLYVHENQLTYPLAPGEQLDLQYGFTNITTALSADTILFNSATQLEAFFDELPRFLKRMPEYRPRWIIEQIRRKSSVLHPGCRFSPREAPSLPSAQESPLIVWNHRWEFDKNPELFFSVLQQVERRGRNFRLALLGENYQKMPKAFIAARRRWPKRIVQYGYVESRRRYLSWLKQGAIVISTADQENFGISVVEAVRYGCHPLLPRALSYPELIPPQFHGDVLYENSKHLVRMLDRLLVELSTADPDVLDRLRHLALSMNRFSWDAVIERYDQQLDRLSRMGGEETPGKTATRSH